MWKAGKSGEADNLQLKQPHREVKMKARDPLRWVTAGRSGGAFRPPGTMEARWDGPLQIVLRR